MNAVNPGSGPHACRQYGLEGTLKGILRFSKVAKEKHHSIEVYTLLNTCTIVMQRGISKGLLEKRFNYCARNYIGGD